MGAAVVAGGDSAPHGILKPGRPRDGQAEHRKGKRTGGHGAIEAFGQQSVVGGVLGHYVEAAALRRPGALHGRNAHQSGIFHRIAELSGLPRREGSDARVEAQDPYRTGTRVPGMDPHLAPRAARQAQAPKGHQQAHREEYPGEAGEHLLVGLHYGGFSFENAVTCKIMAIRIVQVDAFTNRPFAGNPAAVCVLREAPSEQWMRDVAREMNLSETAFLIPREGAPREGAPREGAPREGAPLE